MLKRIPKMFGSCWVKYDFVETLFQHDYCISLIFENDYVGMV